MLVHQVANHCFERGGLMATLWNMYTALMGSKRGDEVWAYHVQTCLRFCWLGDAYNADKTMFCLVHDV